MSLAQQNVDPATVESVKEAFFPPPKTKVWSHYRSLRQQATEEHVCAEMHVVMTIKPCRIRSIKPTEFIDLSLNHVLKTLGEAWIEYNLCETM
jgi:hypothetical protein